MELLEFLYVSRSVGCKWFRVLCNRKRGSDDSGFHAESMEEAIGG